jgi:DNA-binding MarR family transcriptional regulator
MTARDDDQSPARDDDDSVAREAARTRRRRIADAKQSLRALRVELSLLNHRIGARVEVKDIDFDCLDVIAQHGPISPSGLARRAGVHLATMTGILNRLEQNGWITRDRVESDRRAVLVRSKPGRQRDIFMLYRGMNSSLDSILESYSDEAIDVVLDFLQRCTQAGRSAVDELAKNPI